MLHDVNYLIIINVGNIAFFTKHVDFLNNKKTDNVTVVFHKTTLSNIVFKTGSDRPVEPVRPGTGGYTGSSHISDRQCN
jgi:hypothetical protein